MTPSIRDNLIAGSDVVCPFCGEGDFDLPGLKHHLRSGYCEVYEATENVGLFAISNTPPHTEGEDSHG